jgi:hypothetical protein
MTSIAGHFDSHGGGTSRTMVNQMENGDSKSTSQMVVFSFMVCPLRSRVARVAARTHLNLRYGLSVAVRTRRVL